MKLTPRPKGCKYRLFFPSSDILSVLIGRKMQKNRAKQLTCFALLKEFGQDLIDLGPVL
ncbi:MAG: hypothetical protein Sapg2KO_03700 [Saprospiraceae bacterium]